MTADITVRRLGADDYPRYIDALCELLAGCIAGGASLGFMAPVEHSALLAFWDHIFEQVAHDERVLLIAEDAEGHALGTVQIVTAQPANQGHRADVSKLLVHPDARRRGIATSLMAAADVAAVDCGKSLLVLDTATGSVAEGMYTRLGWQLCGVIPDYSRLPDGTLCGTTFFFKTV